MVVSTICVYWTGCNDNNNDDDDTGSAPATTSWRQTFVDIKILPFTPNLSV